MGRAVRVQSQLKSHKRFASAFPRYCRLADSAKLYSTNSTGSAKVWFSIYIYIMFQLLHVSVIKFRRVGK